MLRSLVGSEMCIRDRYQRRVHGEKEKVQKFPTVRVYPPLPIPYFDLEGEPTTQELTKSASRYVQSNVIEVNSANHDTFISDKPSVPKVLLFTEKKGTPLLFRALSVSFEGKLFFGIVRNTEESLVNKYKVKEYPQIIVVKASEKKTNTYKGEIKFSPIFNFLNVYSEAFVPGGESVSESAATKSWLSEVVPELTNDSGNDICFKTEGALCVILLSQDKPEKEHLDTLKQLHESFQRKIDRGFKYNFMWLDATAESKFAQIFEVEKYPQVLILNPGKRKRFLIHEGDITSEALADTFEKIAGGNSLPELSIRKN
eukprot:TRINITY_DN1542_c0_g1_i6.p1 TRINITY_DN1542_c0_g1~~TRINITY_DN1542_c0_g1_i6.p1  ORF type:complete len:314 (-),score=74.97 TRINITY_DN1542_c0_g1_i6:56-997(-)